jgi:hypothetical protein
MWAFINHSGKLREVQNCEFVSDFREGWCVVRSRGIEGIMDRDFCQEYFDSVQHIVGFRNGYSAAKVGRMYGYIDLRGRWVIPPEFTHAQSPNDGYALKLQNGVKPLVCHPSPQRQTRGLTPFPRTSSGATLLPTHPIRELVL